MKTWILRTAVQFVPWETGLIADQEEGHAMEEANRIAGMPGKQR